MFTVFSRIETCKNKFLQCALSILAYCRHWGGGSRFWGMTQPLLSSVAISWCNVAKLFRRDTTPESERTYAAWICVPHSQTLYDTLRVWHSHLSLLRCRTSEPKLGKSLVPGLASHIVTIFTTCQILQKEFSMFPKGNGKWFSIPRIYWGAELQNQNWESHWY